MPTEEPFLHDAIERVQHWASALPETPQPIDAHGPTRFRLRDGAKLAVLGNAFVEPLTAALRTAGVNVEIAAGPPWLSPERRTRYHFGLQSARCGWLETPVAVAEALARATSLDSPSSGELADVNGRIFDLMWDVNPDGFDNAVELERERTSHQRALAGLLEQSDALLVVFGGIEGWRRRSDGAILQLDPFAFPGVPRDRYVFRPCTLDECVDALRSIARTVRIDRPGIRLLFAVSPIPVIATLEPTHVLQADRLAKSTLRLAIETLRGENPDVEYFAILESFDATGLSGTAHAPERALHPAFVEAMARSFVRRFGAYNPGAQPNAADAAEYERPLCDEDELRELMSREFEAG